MLTYYEIKRINTLSKFIPLISLCWCQQHGSFWCRGTLAQFVRCVFLDALRKTSK